MNTAITETNVTQYPLLHRGKVRDIYSIDSDHLLIIATDRVSAFDVILPTPIPNKGAILASIAHFWFQKTESIIPNHCSSIDVREVLTDEQYQQLKHHAVVVKKMNNLPVEAIVRGYISGSGWKDYQKTKHICGIELPLGLQLAEKLPQPIYTPSTKASVGDHDENVAFEHTVSLVGREMAHEIKKVAHSLYEFATNLTREKGIIIADTKFEFGTDTAGRLVLIDEALTPDSSRFWSKQDYRVGISPPSFDKQIIRDYLETLDWDKTSPGPMLPDTIIQKAYNKYREVQQRLFQEHIN